MIGGRRRTLVGSRRSSLGAVGPIVFIAAWTAGSIAAPSAYSPIVDPISRLAAVGAPTRLLMTAGFIGFGVCLVGFSGVVRRAVHGPAWFAVAGTGLATLLVAAAPLDVSAVVDRLHGVAAGTGYVCLVAVPVLAARPLRQAGAVGLAGIGLVAATISTASLAATLAADRVGLWQRVGLTTCDAWVIALAVTLSSNGPRVASRPSTE